MKPRLFYWLVCIGFILFAGEVYLFSAPKNVDALFAHAFNNNDHESVEQVPVAADTAAVHENVSEKPGPVALPVAVAQPQVVLQPQLKPNVESQQEKEPTATPTPIPGTNSEIKQVTVSKTLKLPDLAQDTRDYPRIPATTFPETKDGKPLQFIVFAFDGSGALSSWDQTYLFAQDMRKKVSHFSFTYFINPVYLLTSANKDVYMSPDGVIGASAIGFGGSEDSIKTRITDINRAIHDGHDVESHAVGHWNGSKFSSEQWNHELESFNKLVFGMGALYPGYNIELNPKDLIGFRAPELGTDDHMYTTLHDLGYKYDTSKVQIHPAWPRKDSNGIWEFPLDVISRGTSGKNVLAMDFNFYFVQTNAKSTAHRGTSDWNHLYQETFLSYQNYFQSHYDGGRAPVYMANHFGFWNDGVYWEVMKQVAQDECTKPDVFCGSYKDLYDYMELHPELEGVK